MIKEERSERSEVTDFEDGGRDPSARKYGKSKEAGNSKETKYKKRMP